MKGPTLHSIRNEPVTVAPTLAPFEYQSLTRLVVGPGSLERLGEFARELGGTRVLLVTDPGLEEAGHPQRALASLRHAGLETFVFDGVEENPTTIHVQNGLDAARTHRIDLLVAVGGGSSMDCAKGINFLYTNGGRMADYKGKGKATRPMLPSIGVPTTAGTGSEAQSYALIADARTHMKMACGDRKAAFRVSILDPELTESQPRGVAAVTGIDAMTHAIESFVCTRRNPLSAMYARDAWRMLEGNFESALRQAKNMEARSAMQLGAHFAGVAIENSMLGAAHACANPLTAHYGLTHGIAVGILLPHVVRFNAEAVAPLYAELVHDVGLINGDHHAAGAVLAQLIVSFLELAGLPTARSGCGVSKTILPLLAEEASQQWTGRFNPRPAGERELLDIFEAAW
jgi:alcohol dehydrogenase